MIFAQALLFLTASNCSRLATARVKRRIGRNELQRRVELGEFAGRRRPRGRRQPPPPAQAEIESRRNDTLHCRAVMGSSLFEWENRSVTAVSSRAVSRRVAAGVCYAARGGGTTACGFCAHPPAVRTVVAFALTSSGILPPSLRKSLRPPAGNMSHVPRLIIGKPAELEAGVRLDHKNAPAPAPRISPPSSSTNPTESTSPRANTSLLALPRI